MICFDNSTPDKTLKDVTDFGVKADPLLVHIVSVIDDLLHDHETHAIITSFIREEGVHATGRAVDLRSRTLNSSACYLIENMVNNRFPRSDGLRTCLYHDVGMGVHFHIQVMATG